MSRRERQRRRRRNRGSPLKRFFALTGLLTVAAATIGALAIAGWVINVAQSAPNLTELHPRLPGSPSEIYAADGSLLGYITSSTIRMPIASAAIPERLKEATIAIEDRRFYHHGALDYQGILRAAVRDALHGGSGGLQGASTLTMQLVDNLYLQKVRTTRTLQYKIEQAKLALQLESRHAGTAGKNWILTGYLNDVPYGTVGGQTAYGVAAAARIFFDKPVQTLTLPQEALLAGLPQAPSDYNPFIDKAAALHRRAEVLQAMANARYITQAQADAAARKPLEVHHDNIFAVRRLPYAFDYIRQQVALDLCPRRPKRCQALQQGGLKIYSTIDPQRELWAQQAIDDHASLIADQGGPGVAAALASVDPTNGHVVAIANSSNYAQTPFDYATQALRQTGSAFKVFALMTLIHDYDGDPNSTYYTSRQLTAGWLPSAPAWSVHTDTNTYNGTINLTKATIISDNTVYAQLIADLGVDKMNAMAHAMGITSPLDLNPAEVLGGLTIGVTPLQMANAYGTIANQGVHIPTTVIDHVVFPDGSVRSFANPVHSTVFTPGEAYAATNVLKQVVTNPSGTGTAASYGCPVAGKTGTAEHLDNAWFVGYSPRLSTAVWVGNPSGNVAMYNGFGGVLAAPIWQQYMKNASEGFCGDFPQPTTPFVGTAFAGPHSASGPEGGAQGYGSGSGNGYGGSATTPGTAGGATGAGANVNSYNNPTLYAPGVQGAATPPTGTGAGGATGTGGGPGTGGAGGAPSGNGGGGAPPGGSGSGKGHPGGSPSGGTSGGAPAGT
jgi:penicillin-binding protein 1A